MAVRQYVITAPTGFQTASTNRYRSSLKRVHGAPPVKVLASLHEDSDKLVEMSDAQLSEVKSMLPGLIIEPNILYRKFRHPILEGFEQISLPAAATTKTVTITVKDEATQNPISDVTLYLVVDQVRKIGFKGVTDGSGECRFTARSTTDRFDLLALLPKHGYWNRSVKSVVIDDAYEVTLRPLLDPAQGEVYDWGHRFSQMTDDAASGGSGVKVAVIDTGIRRDHPDLSPSSQGRNCVFGEDPDRWYDDGDGHGSHCAGVIGALMNGHGIKGYVPKAEILAYRVFADNADGASTFDIASAIQLAVEDGCDIISMSLGSETAQAAIRTKIELAYEKGVLCIAATGNEGSSVGYPAAFPSVIGVGAFGRIGSYPIDSLHADNESSIRSVNGEYYVANFSNFGAGTVDFCAPGVAILSTVPGGYSAWDGTSMACPQVTGIAALALASHSDILNANRDGERVERLTQLLTSQAQMLGFGSDYEGVGCLGVDRILGT
jgi:subtilisin